eukprot:g13873.t1
MGREQQGGATSTLQWLDSMADFREAVAVGLAPSRPPPKTQLVLRKKVWRSEKPLEHYRIGSSIQTGQERTLSNYGIDLLTARRLYDYEELPPKIVQQEALAAEGGREQQVAGEATGTVRDITRSPRTAGSPLSPDAVGEMSRRAAGSLTHPGGKNVPCSSGRGTARPLFDLSASSGNTSPNTDDGDGRAASSSRSTPSNATSEKSGSCRCRCRLLDCFAGLRKRRKEKVNMGPRLVDHIAVEVAAMQQDPLAEALTARKPEKTREEHQQEHNRRPTYTAEWSPRTHDAHMLKDPQRPLLHDILAEGVLPAGQISPAKRDMIDSSCSKIFESRLQSGVGQDDCLVTPAMSSKFNDELHQKKSSSLRNTPTRAEAHHHDLRSTQKNSTTNGQEILDEGGSSADNSFPATTKKNRDLRLPIRTKHGLLSPAPGTQKDHRTAATPAEADSKAVELREKSLDLLIKKTPRRKTRCSDQELILNLPPHPNVLQLLAAWDDGQCFYFEMPLLRHYKDLFQALDEHVNACEMNQDRPLFVPPRRVREILKGVLRGVHHLHEHGVVHGDLKPENIMVAGDIDDSRSSGWSRSSGGLLLRSAAATNSATTRSGRGSGKHGAPAMHNRRHVQQRYAADPTGLVARAEFYAVLGELLCQAGRRISAKMTRNRRGQRPEEVGNNRGNWQNDAGAPSSAASSSRAPAAGGECAEDAPAAALLLVFAEQDDGGDGAREPGEAGSDAELRTVRPHEQARAEEPQPAGEALPVSVCVLDKMNNTNPPRSSCEGSRGAPENVSSGAPSRPSAGCAPLEVKVIDFDRSTFVSNELRAGPLPVGTSGYVVPENLLGFYFPESDVFAAGHVLFVLLTANNLWHDRTAQKVARTVITSMRVGGEKAGATQLAKDTLHQLQRELGAGTKGLRELACAGGADPDLVRLILEEMLQWDWRDRTTAAGALASTCLETSE